MVKKIEKVVDIENQEEKIHVLVEIVIDLENANTDPMNVVVEIEKKRDTEIPTLNMTTGKHLKHHFFIQNNIKDK